MTTLYIKIAAALVIILGLFGTGWYVGSLNGKAAVARLQRDQAQSLATALEGERQQRAIKELTYEREIDQLKTDSLQYPAVAVRLCPPSQLPSPTSPRQNLPAPGRVLPNITVKDRSSPDVGPALFALADYADEIVAKCRSN